METDRSGRHGRRLRLTARILSFGDRVGKRIRRLRQGPDASPDETWALEQAALALGGRADTPEHWRDLLGRHLLKELSRLRSTFLLENRTVYPSWTDAERLSLSSAQARRAVEDGLTHLKKQVLPRRIPAVLTRATILILVAADAALTTPPHSLPGDFPRPRTDV